jgi:hypothetical protein
MPEVRMTARLFLIGLMAAFFALPASAQDVGKGKIVFQQCMICHAIGTGAQNKIGPELNGLDGRHAGTVADFDYSDATPTTRCPFRASRIPRRSMISGLASGNSTLTAASEISIGWTRP